MKDLQGFGDFLKQRQEMLGEIADKKELNILPELRQVQGAIAMMNLYLDK